MEISFLDLNTFLKTRYGQKVYKVCVDGGFTCPNRDGTCGNGGCIFCGDRGAGEHLNSHILDISTQVREGILQLEKRNVQRFIVYFQNFSNTYASVEELRRKYRQALVDSRIVVLAVGTRPDCVTEEITEVLAEFLPRCDVWVELGLQTASDRTAALLNRGYSSEVFTKAVRQLRAKNLNVITHIILGLPGETFEDVQATVEFLNRHDIQGIKIHSLYVMEGTKLAEMYRRGEFTPITQEEYVRQAAYVVKNIRPGTVIHRLTGDCPPGMLVAPEWNREKHKILSAIHQKLEHDSKTELSIK
ncbi:MAG: TIGR01212 family radical SAM protein [Planctomycetia bacterium]|nr:TIGR01212 family radical SAM protein [Planctomycetia bacterium]